MNKRMNRCRKVLLLVIVLSLFLSIPTASIAETEKSTSYDLKYFYQIMKFVKENYAFDISEDELIEGALKGLFYSLDDYSDYYTKEEIEALMENVSGDFVGIGVVIKEKDGYVEIEYLIEGSPAYKVGMKAQDKIISIDGKNTKGLSIEKIVSLIKGEEGTKVKIGVKRQEENTPIYFTITREKIKMNPISHKTIDEKIGYINISQFNSYTYENLVPVLKEFDKKNISSIIVDLRDNPGGFLEQVVKVSNHFVPKGPIVHIKYKDKTKQTYCSHLPKVKYNLVVLVNENSASASEIFAGAVQDTNAGTIVGVTTFGKGTVQEIISLPYGDGMKLTIAEYLTPKGRSINGKGVVPDVVVKNTNPKVDAQLEKAIEILKK